MFLAFWYTFEISRTAVLLLSGADGRQTFSPLFCRSFLVDMDVGSLETRMWLYHAWVLSNNPPAYSTISSA